MSVITEPGFYYDMPSAVYHRDPCVIPSLSSGVARTLIEQTPAHAFLQHSRLGGKKTEPTPAMIFGGYLHGLCAGDTSDYETGPFENYTTKAAKEWRDCVEANGRTPVLDKVAERARLVLAALKEKAAPDLTVNPFVDGKAEVSGFWEEKGTWFRARYDRLILQDPIADAWDWKTTTDISEDGIIRTIIDHGYHVQAAHYLRGLRALAPQFEGRCSFILVFVETEAPFAVRRVPLSEGFLQMGERLLERAIADWRSCLASNQWPDRSAGSMMITPPDWYARKLGFAA